MSLRSRFDVSPVVLLSLAVVLSGCAVALSGCDGVKRPPLRPVRPDSPGDAANLPPAESELLEPPGRPFESSWETWDAYFIRDSHVGFIHVTAESKADAAEVVYKVEHHLSLRRDGSTLIQRLSQRSVETSTGELIRFDSRRHVGPVMSEDHGVVDEGILRVETVRGGERVSYKIPWQPSIYRGLLGVEQSLRRHPMTEGEVRLLRMPIPVAGSYQIATVQLSCGTWASVPMLDGGARKLLEIENEIRLGEQRFESMMWADEQGNVMRTYSPTYRMFAYRVDRQAALGDDEHDDATSMLAFDVQGRVPKQEGLNQVGFVLSPTRNANRDTDPISLEPAPGQFVRRMDDGTLRVLVSRGAEKAPAGYDAVTLEPTAEDLEVSALIDFNAPPIRRLVDDALLGRSELDPRKIALLLTQATEQKIQQKTDRFTGFRPASKIVAKGDSTDHAVLLTALLRARDIPARLAFGLVYVEGEVPRMHYHSWTLAHVDGDWLPLDATTGMVADPDRLTFGTSNVSGSRWYASMDPIVGAVGRIEVKIAGAR